MYINVVIFFQLVFILYFDSLSRRHLILDCYFYLYLLLFHWEERIHHSQSDGIYKAHSTKSIYVSGGTKS